MLLAGFFKHINFTNQAENITGLLCIVQLLQNSFKMLDI